MAIVTQPVITQPGPAQDEAPSREQRGTTTIPAKVVAQIAAQAAYETGDVDSDIGELLGTGVRHDFASRSEAQCELCGRVTVLYLDLNLVFPTPLFSIIDDLHTHVCDRVEHLTGLSVGKTIVEISWLNPNSHVRKSLK